MSEYRLALRPDHRDPELLDDVVVTNVSMFRAEMMSDKQLWMACYFPDSDERVTFWVTVNKGKLSVTATEYPTASAEFTYEDGGE